MHLLVLTFSLNFAITKTLQHAVFSLFCAGFLCFFMFNGF